MSHRLLHLRLSEFDPAAVRTRSREVAKRAKLESLQQTRMATAVSEIARNAVEHGSDGTLEFRIEPAPDGRGQCLVALVRDTGRGIADVPAALGGQLLPSGRVANGIPGSRRLVDRMTIESKPATGTQVRLEMDLPRSAGTFSPAAIAAIALALEQATPLSALAELREQNLELLRVHQELRAKQVALELADGRKNEFVKTLAHELRNPLSTLQMTLDLIRHKPEMGPQALLERCAVMGRQTAQLNTLIEELMDAARVSQGKVQLQQQAVDLNTVVSNALEMTGGAIAAKSHQVAIRLSPEPAWVNVDVPRLTQVTCNLIQNAARYTPTNGRIEVQVGREGRQGVLSVKDNGIGIAADLLPHVFELFVQGSAGAGGGEGGMGIGLSLVHNLVALHGGEVSVASAGAGQGSTFTVRLPLFEEQAATA